MTIRHQRADTETMALMMAQTRQQVEATGTMAHIHHLRAGTGLMGRTRELDLVLLVN